MSQERLDRFRANLELFNRTGEARGIAPDFELHQSDSIIDTAGVFRGPDSIRRSLSELEGSFDDLTFEAEEFLEAPGGEIVVLIRAGGRGRGSGLVLDNEIAWVFEFRGDEAVRMVIYEERTDALKAVGLAN